MPPHPTRAVRRSLLIELGGDPTHSKAECAKRAVALLQQAVGKGWKNADHMKKDDDLKALRERDDFKKLLADLEAANAKKP